MNSKYQFDLVVGCAFEKLFRDLDRMFFFIVEALQVDISPVKRSTCIRQKVKWYIFSLSRLHIQNTCSHNNLYGQLYPFRLSTMYKELSLQARVWLLDCILIDLYCSLSWLKKSLSLLGCLGALLTVQWELCGIALLKTNTNHCLTYYIKYSAK